MASISSQGSRNSQAQGQKKVGFFGRVKKLLTKKKSNPQNRPVAKVNSVPSNVAQQDTTPKNHFEGLCTDIINNIAQHLSKTDISTFARTSKDNHKTIKPTLQKLKEETELKDIKPLRDNFMKFIENSKKRNSFFNNHSVAYQKSARLLNIYAERLLTIEPESRKKDLEALFKTTELNKADATQFLLVQLRNIQVSCEEKPPLSRHVYSKSSQESINLYGKNDHISTVPIETDADKEKAIRIYKESTEEILKILEEKITSGQVKPTNKDLERITKLKDWIGDC